MKYATEADARDQNKDTAMSNRIKIMEGMGFLMQDNYRRAAISLSQVNLSDTQEVNNLLTPSDIAFYITLSSLLVLNRKEMRENIISSSKFKSLLDSVPEISDILEHFLNGRYMEFQKSMDNFKFYMQFDPFFGHKIDTVIEKIRKKALVQYVTPYKIIDLREIAKAFNISLEKIEEEIAELIVSKQIQAKIDSHSKLLYSRKENEMINSYNEAIELGDMFIKQTEQALLRVQLLKKKKILKGMRGLGYEQSTGRGKVAMGTMGMA